MSDDERTQKHRLPPGGTLVLSLPEGAELHCTSGQAILTGTPQMTGDSLWVPARPLPAGQSWRAGLAGPVTLRNPQASPCLLTVERPFAQGQGEPAKQNRLAAFADRRWSGLWAEALACWIRRVPSAASAKTP